MQIAKTLLECSRPHIADTMITTNAMVSSFYSYKTTSQLTIFTLTTNLANVNFYG